MDVSQALKDAENSIRDFLPIILSSQYGDDWINKLGVSGDRISQWRDRQAEDIKRLGSSDERLLYYADFYDLKTIIEKNWANGIKEVFGDKKTIDVWLKTLEKFRNPDAHRREIFEYQKHLVLGISGDIRSKIIRYRSNMNGPERYYAQIESVQDNLGNTWSVGSQKLLTTGNTLRPGDVLEFVITASDPRGESLEYIVLPTQGKKLIEWNTSGNISLRIEEEHVYEAQWINIAVRSNRKYHPVHLNSAGKVDDIVKFAYSVLPDVGY